MLSLGNHGCVLWFKLPSLSESNLHLCSPLGTITLYSGVGEGEEDGRSGKNVRSPLFPFTAALSLARQLSWTVSLSAALAATVS